MIPSLGGESIEDYSLRVAEKNKFGKKGRDNGVLLVIAKEDHKLRIEVGYGLEGVLTDAACDQIIRHVIAPKFKQNDFAGGIEAGVNAIMLATKGEFKGEPEPTRNRGPNMRLVFFLFFIVFSLFSHLITRHRRVYVGRNGYRSAWPWFGGFGGGGFGGGWGGGAARGAGDSAEAAAVLAAADRAGAGRLLKRYLKKDDLKFLSGKIAGAEQRTNGEIRIVLRHRRHWNERSLSLHELALREFYHLGMHKTPHRTGVLILLLLAERKFQIIADEGIHAKVPDGTWDSIAAVMSEHFKKGNYRDGLAKASEAVGGVLARHVPRTDERDRLSNDVVEE